MKKFLSVLVLLAGLITLLLQYVYEVEYPEITNYQNVRITDVKSKNSDEEFKRFVNSNQFKIIKIETAQYDSKIQRKVFSNTKKVPKLKAVHNIEYQYKNFNDIDNIRGQYYFSVFNEEISKKLSKMGIATLNENITIKEKIRYLFYTTELKRVILIFSFIIIVIQVMETIAKSRKYKLLKLDGFSVWDIGKIEYKKNIIFVSVLSVVLGSTLFFIATTSFLGLFFLFVSIIVLYYTLVYWGTIPVYLIFSSVNYNYQYKDSRKFLFIMMIGQLILSVQFILAIELVSNQLVSLDKVNETVKSNQIDKYSAIDLSSMIPIDPSENLMVADMFKNDLSDKNIRLDFFERDYGLTSALKAGEYLTVNKNYFSDQSIILESGEKIKKENINIENSTFLLLIPEMYKSKADEIITNRVEWYRFLTNKENISPVVKYTKNAQVTKSVAYNQNIDELIKYNAVYCLVDEDDISSDIFLSLLSDRQILIENKVNVVDELKNSELSGYIYTINPISYYINQEIYKQYVFILVYVVVNLIIMVLIGIYAVLTTKLYLTYNLRKFRLLKLEGISNLKVIRNFIFLLTSIDIMASMYVFVAYDISKCTLGITVIIMFLKWLFVTLYTMFKLEKQ